MNLLIAGSRSFTDYNFLERTVLGFADPKDIDCIISGTAVGADSLGELFARIHKIPVKQFPANWDLHGKKAGFIRNKTLVDECDMAIIFWDGESSGTSHTISLLESAKKDFVVVQKGEKQ